VAEIVVEISSSEYAIDGNLSRFAWMPGHYNMWKGFAVEPSRETSCDLFLDHLYTIVCNRDDAAYTYLLDWMAFNVETPWKCRKWPLP